MGNNSFRKKPEKIKSTALTRRLCNRPTFKLNEKVWVKLQVINSIPPNIIRGKVLGKAEMYDIWDYWIVKLSGYPRNGYPYSCIAVKHDSIVARISKQKPKIWIKQNEA